MVMSSYQLLPLEESDIIRCVDIYFTSFQNPHSLACWPRDSPHVRAWWEKMFHDELHEPGAYWLKIVEENGQIVGYGKWCAPKHGVELDTSLPEWPQDADAKLCDETFGAWARTHKDLMGSRGHWYLEMVAVDPKWQGKGVGSAFMKFGTDKEDEQGVEAFLEASPEGVPLYKKFGFTEAAKLDTLIDNERIKKTWYRNVFMVRPAKTSAVSAES